ncbi:MAG: PilW family protein [Thiolinea sp.]
MIYNSFSVGNSSFRNSVGTLIPSLRCGGSRLPVRQSWAQGVENIQFLYGVDTDGDGAVENYWNATAVSNNAAWGQIITVQVGLLIRTVDPVFDQTQSETFQVLDELIVTNDRYKRGVYTTTIRLKNVARRI